MSFGSLQLLELGCQRLQVSGVNLQLTGETSWPLDQLTSWQCLVWPGLSTSLLTNQSFPHASIYLVQKRDIQSYDQSDKPSGSCVTDSIYLDWKAPAVDGGRWVFQKETLVHQKIKLRHVSTRPILGYSVEMYDLPTGNWVTVTQTDDGATRQVVFLPFCSQKVWHDTI